MDRCGQMWTDVWTPNSQASLSETGSVDSISKMTLRDDSP